MKILVIGATGHIGTYLVPRLLAAGHRVAAMHRGNREPYSLKPAWRQVEKIHLDRREEEKKGTFAIAVAAVGAEVIIDLILFDRDSLAPLVEALRGRCRHYVCCGTMWVYGPTEFAPTREEHLRLADEDYGRNKAEVELELLRLSACEGFPATTLHPGHIVGPGWPPIGPTGNLDLTAFEKLGRGEEVCLPDMGLGTLHHVHADDVAQAFERAVECPNVSIGESFNVVSPEALTLRGLCRAVAGWFGREPRLTYLPWD
ncbi:MAG: NAD-dependent epimerase/dehydratase family protein, partial [Candidatus Glassbacteria bacterium]|nr:NAD-dependent epimerase/dehydratase family protein [Candidatus Glassbacteria bacterium]